MPLVVARQEHDGEASDLTHAQGRRGLAPGAAHAARARLFEPREIINAGAADDAQDGFGHAVTMSIAISLGRQTQDPESGMADVEQLGHARRATLASPLPRRPAGEVDREAV